jgi:C-terminal processing protease CtpA/Prc
VLTSGRTSGTAEVVAWLLQREKRAAIVGEQTAKRPTISRTYDIDQTWQIRLATYDFAGPKGERLQKRGVRPDVRSKRDDAPKEAVKFLLDQLKTPGA